ncbi:MAG: nucleoside hydrolase [Simkaniaceae bacterium]|jgi:inosine-uridine nucleoside N-ribohydrolase
MLRKILLILAPLFLVHSFCEAKSDFNLSHPMTLIIDSDADVDDMIAILYLLNTPRVDIDAITTVGDGASRWEYGARNISNLLELVGHPRIPVSYGAKKSLSPAGNFPTEWRNDVDNVMGVKLPINPVSPVRLRSAELMTDIIMKSPVKITLLAIGPLTNIAIALSNTPEIKDNIERVYMMGGAILVPGNIVGRPQGFRNRVAEYNIFLDAKAAQDVFDSGIPITLIPLDATQHVPVTPDFFKRLSKERKTPSSNFVYEVLKPYMNTERKIAYFWDPLAAVVMTHPEIATYRELKLTINLKKGPEYGRVMMTKTGASVQVATGINAEAFYDIFLQTLNRSSHLKPNYNESK